MQRSTRTRVWGIGLVGVLVGALMSTPSAGAGTAGADQRGRQVFLLVQTDPSVEGGPIAAFGPIHARGVDVVTGEFRDRFEFPDGNLVIRHRPREGSAQESFDEETCYFRFSERGRWWVVRGTGAYADASGGGRYRALGEGFGCSETEPPEVFYLKIRAQGHLSY